MPSGLHYGRPNSVQDAEAFTETFEQSGAFVAPDYYLMALFQMITMVMM